LGVTGHYIISSPENPHQWDLKTEQLAFTPIVGNHSGENIAKILLKTVDAFGLRPKVFISLFLIISH
jgi:hypothetical protein